ncbi:MAG TPA: response regulator transcription factor [Bryobacteraceae bacterium]|nr:response regulator transcription factor [Bryobacteraceae bacterium]
MNSFKVYVCENQPVTVEGLRRVFERHTEIQMIGQAPDLGVAIAELASMSADVLLLGQPHAAKSILPLLSQAREADLQTATVLWVGELSEMDSFRALQLGARGIVRKTQPVDILIECLRTVAGGSVFLENALRANLSGSSRRNGALRITPREREIVEFVCRGMKNREIAEALSITPGTVKVHLMHIFEKTGVKDRFQLALQGKQFLNAAEEESALRKVAEA